MLITLSIVRSVSKDVAQAIVTLEKNDTKIGLDRAGTRVQYPAPPSDQNAID